MKKSVLKFGLFSSLTLVILFAIQFSIEDKLNYSSSEVFGYVSIVLALLFIYFAVKHYRDTVNNGLVSFGKALLIGVLVSLLAGLTFGIINYVYVEVINPEFMTEYYDYMVEKARTSMTAEEFQIKLQAMEAEKALFSNSIISSLVMSATVLIIGFIISLISGLILQRK
jgi:F0F1-type ATP synthase assembly protein I